MANADSPSSRLWFQRKAQGPLFGDRYHVASESSRRWLEVVDGLLAGSIRERDAMRGVAGLIDLFDRAFCKAMSRDRWGEELERNPEYKKSWERQNEGARAAGFRAMPRCWTKLDQRFVERLDGKRTDDWPRRRVDRVIGYSASWLSALQPIAERAVESSSLPAHEDLRLARVTFVRLGVDIPELLSTAKKGGLGVDGFEKACTVVLGLRRLAPTLRFLSLGLSRNDVRLLLYSYVIGIARELKFGDFTATGNALFAHLGTIRAFHCPVNDDRQFDLLNCLADYEACLASESLVSARLTDLESLLHRIPFRSPFRGKLNPLAGEPIWDAKVVSDRLFAWCEGIRSHFDLGLVEQEPTSQSTVATPQVASLVGDEPPAQPLRTSRDETPVASAAVAISQRLRSARSAKTAKERAEYAMRGFEKTHGREVVAGWSKRDWVRRLRDAGLRFGGDTILKTETFREYEKVRKRSRGEGGGSIRRASTT